MARSRRCPRTSLQDQFRLCPRAPQDDNGQFWAQRCTPQTPPGRCTPLRPRRLRGIHPRTTRPTYERTGWLVPARFRTYLPNPPGACGFPHLLHDSPGTSRRRVCTWLHHEALHILAINRSCLRIRPLCTDGPASNSTNLRSVEDKRLDRTPRPSAPRDRYEMPRRTCKVWPARSSYHSTPSPAIYPYHRRHQSRPFIRNATIRPDIKCDHQNH